MTILLGPDYDGDPTALPVGAVRVTGLTGLASGTIVAVRATSIHDQQTIESQFPDLMFRPSLSERDAIEAFNAGITYPDATSAKTIYRFFLLGQAYFAAVPVTPYTEPAMDSDGNYLDGAGVYAICAQELSRFVMDRHHLAYSFWAVDVALLASGPVVVGVQDGSDAVLPDLMSADVFYSILESKLNGTCCR